MVLPLRDRLATRSTPWVNRLLLLINLGVFVLLEPWAAPSPCTQEAFFLQHAAIPREITEAEPLDAREVALATDPACGLEANPDKNVWFSIVSAMFLHAGWGHLLGNLLFLWIFGDNVEDAFGHLGYLAFYLVSGVLATMAFVVPAADSLGTLVGASGAIAAVLGSYLVMFPRSRITVIVLPFWFLPFRLPALLVLGFWLFVQFTEVEVASMSGGGVAYLAHIAGFIVGMIATWLLRPDRHKRPPARSSYLGY
jgi:membrane associated rhomboid family serine protease